MASEIGVLVRRLTGSPTGWMWLSLGSTPRQGIGFEVSYSLGGVWTMGKRLMFPSIEFPDKRFTWWESCYDSPLYSSLNGNRYTLDEHAGQGWGVEHQADVPAFRQPGRGPQGEDATDSRQV